MSVELKLVRGPKKRAFIYTAHGSSLSKAKAFAYNIAQFTTAEIRRVAATVGDKVDIPAVAGDFQSLDHYAHIWLRRDDDDKLYALKIVAPVISMFEEQPKGDLIVIPDIGAQIAAYYSDLAGETFTFNEGAFCGSNV